MSRSGCDAEGNEPIRWSKQLWRNDPDTTTLGSNRFISRSPGHLESISYKLDNLYDAMKSNISGLEALHV